MLFIFCRQHFAAYRAPPEFRPTLAAMLFCQRVQHQAVSAVADESRQVALPIEPIDLPSSPQLLQPIVIAQVGGGLGQIEIAMKPTMRERAVTDRQRLFGIDLFRDGRIRMLSRTQPCSFASRL